MRRLLPACLLLSLSAALLASCSSDDDDGPAPNQGPAVADAQASPSPAGRGGTVLFTAECSDPDGSVVQVVIDLSSLGGSAWTGMLDDGAAGDAAADDGVFTCRYIVPLGTAPQAGLTLTVTATDDDGASASAAISGFEVSSNYAPTLANAAAAPAQNRAGLPVLFTVDAADSDGTLSSVTVDLSSLGGSATQTMYDDGTHGDTGPADGSYAYSHTPPVGTALGTRSCLVTATDNAGDRVTASAAFEVVANIPPTLQNPTAAPATVNQGENVHLTVDATDADGTVSSVVVDLSSIGGAAAQALYDDGTNGDATALDNVYTFDHTVGFSSQTGSLSLTVTATDDSAGTAQTGIALTVNPNPGPAVTDISPPHGGVTIDYTGQDTVILTANVQDPQGVASVSVNLSPVGGSGSLSLFDDGSHNDGASGDDVWGAQFTVPAHAPGGLQTLTLTALDGATPAAQTQVNVSLRIVRVRMHKANFLYAVHGTGSSHVVAAGEQGAFYRYDGSQWLMEDIGDTQTNRLQNGVRAFASGDVFTAGAGMASSSYNGTSWTYGTVSAAGHELRGVWGAGASDLYVVGSNDQVHHWNGTAWTDLSSSLPHGTGGSYTAVDGHSSTQFIAVGYNGLITRGTGSAPGTWTDESIPACPDDFFDVACLGNNHYVAVGGNTTTPAPVIYESTSAGVWNQVTAHPAATDDLRGIWAGSATDIWIVGGNGLLWRWSTTTSSYQSFASPTQENLLAVWGSGTNDVWAVGGKGTILHYGGSSWQVRHTATWVQAEALAAAPTNQVWVFDTSATAPAIQYYNGTSWSLETNPMTTPQPFRDAFAVSAGDVWAVADGGSVLRRTSGSWAMVTGHGLTQDLHAVWASGPSSVFLGGASGTVVLHDPTQATWTSYSGVNGLATVDDLWGAAGDLYAVAGTQIYHNDGTDTSFTSVHSAGSGNDLNGLWASGTTDVWAVGANGYVANGDSSGFSQVVLPGSPAEDLYAVFGLGPNEIYIVGDNFALFRYDGSNWRRLSMRCHTNLRAGAALSSTAFVCGERDSVFQILR